ncbi:MAG TPA: HEPN domain-containing protein [Verrucomicrobiae bacterium]|nr:HEPN domain-containing protein [Verrucomicrobiae bacterium]
MSLEKHQAEAKRWLSQAQSDLRAARGSVTQSAFEWAAFQAQQAGEKSIKALWYHNGLDPWGHSLAELIQEFPLPNIRSQLTPFLDHAKHLDKLYIPTRYPNGLPALTPSEVFTKPEAEQAIEKAHQIIEHVAAQMKA